MDSGRMASVNERRDVHTMLIPAAGSGRADAAAHSPVTARGVASVVQESRVGVVAAVSTG